MKKKKHAEEIPVSELARMSEELSEWKNKYMLTLAESENMRKRLGKEKQDFIEFAKRDMLRELLDPVDQLTTALSHADNSSEEVRQWAMGFKMILSQLDDFLKSQGVTSFDSLGEQFDPSRHEALEAIETDDEPAGKIVREYKRGYLVGKALLRPAQVQVTKAAIEEPILETKEQGEIDE